MNYIKNTVRVRIQNQKETKINLKFVEFFVINIRKSYLHMHTFHSLLKEYCFNNDKEPILFMTSETLIASEIMI